MLYAASQSLPPKLLPRTRNCNNDLSSGNSLVIIVILRHRRMRTITNFFLANLAVADLCVGVFCLLPNLSQYLSPYWLLGKVSRFNIICCRAYQYGSQTCKHNIMRSATCTTRTMKYLMSIVDSIDIRPAQMATLVEQICYNGVQDCPVSK